MIAPQGPGFRGAGTLEGVRDVGFLGGSYLLLAGRFNLGFATFIVMDRRQFALLSKSLFAGSAMTSGGRALAVEGEPTRGRVIVIGAGLAGLAAARSLKVHGYEVLVLEGRDRIGGRIHTSTQWEDLPLDLGASWIHETRGNPLTALAAEAKATLLETSYDSSIAYDTDGSELSASDEALLDELREQVEAILERAQDGPADQTLREALASLVGTDAPASTRRLVRFIISSEIETEYAGSAGELSAYWYDNMGGYAGPDKLFAAGFRVIVDHLAQGLDIRTGKVVTGIDWSESLVRVATAGGEDFDALKVLVTLPLGVLKTGQPVFTPPLPVSKQEAIAKLGMGLLNKCYLRFDSVFWDEDVDWIEYIPDTHGEWTEWVSFKRAADKPVLLGFLAAEQAVAKESLTDEQIVSSAMTVLRTLYGDDIPEPIDYQITRWASDRFARGSYSFNAVHSTPAMRRSLAAPMKGRLFFAGEATEETYFATAHGAYRSGIRAAEEMIVPEAKIDIDYQSSPPDAVLSWDSTPNVRYRVENSATLAPNSWAELEGGIAPTGDEITYRVPIAEDTLRMFFRIVKE